MLCNDCRRQGHAACVGEHPAPRFPNLEALPTFELREVEEGCWEMLSGPEYHAVGTPRRRRKLWVVRRAIGRDGVAYNGWATFDSKEKAERYFNRRELLARGEEWDR